MESVQKFLVNLDWVPLIFFCLIIGLAPFTPPHLFEKLQMLVNGELKKAIDWLDLFMHGAPWLVLIAKVVAISTNK